MPVTVAQTYLRTVFAHPNLDCGHLGHLPSDRPCFQRRIDAMVLFCNHTIGQPAAGTILIHLSTDSPQGHVLTRVDLAGV